MYDGLSGDKSMNIANYNKSEVAQHAGSLQLSTYLRYGVGCPVSAMIV